MNILSTRRGSKINSSGPSSDTKLKEARDHLESSSVADESVESTKASINEGMELVKK